MTKLVTLEIIDGNFETGFKLRVSIGEEGEPQHLNVSFRGSLPKDSTIPDSYQDWQNSYLKLDKRWRARTKGTKAGDTEQITIQCNDSATQLKKTFKNWLSNSSQDSKFQLIREKLCQNLGNDKSTEIRVIIQTDDALLKKLPWHEWDLFADEYLKAEVAVGAMTLEETSFPVRSDQLKILAILGNSEGINIEEDRKTLESYKSSSVDINFLTEPDNKDINKNLWKNHWNILFFAGHSSSQGEKGRIFINRTDSLTIEDLKYGLRQAIQGGLQLAIFNSCDGLKLAEELVANLKIPQVIFMREPVIDKVAHAFFKFFLEQLSKGESFYLAVRHARERLCENFDDQFPGASWLPAIYQNPAVVPPSWEQLRMLKSENIQPEPTQSGKKYQGGPVNQPHQQRQVVGNNSPSSQEVDVNNGDDDDGIMSKLRNVQFILTQFLPGLIAGIGGLALMMALIVYRDIIQPDILSDLTQTQASIVIFSIVGLTFFIVIISIYTWLATREGIQFKHVLVFMALILTILAFILAAFYLVNPTGERGGDKMTLNEKSRPPQEPPNDWYLKAMAALKNGNKSIALAYVDRGLEKTPKTARTPVASLLAVKMKILFLTGGQKNRDQAKEIADQNYGNLSILDRWIDCLKTNNFFEDFTTESELEAQCPFPNFYQ